MAIKDIDPALELPQKGDIVRFHTTGFEWRVTKVVPWQNVMFVESLVGKRMTRAAITSVLTIQRDTKFKPEPSHLDEYDNWEDDIEEFI
jgi:hypothetical protein